MEFLIVPGAIAALLGVVLITGRDDTVEINDIVPHPTYESLGFTDEALTQALMLELRRLIYAADTTPGAPVVDVARESSIAESLAQLIGVESMVNQIRQYLGEIDYAVSAHFTEVDGVSVFNVVVDNYEQSTETALSYTVTGPDPIPAINQFARDLLLMVDPYVLALDSFTRGNDTGDFEETLELIEYGFARGPDELAHRYYNLRGLIHAHLGDNAAALRDFEIALITGSDDIYSHFNRAIALGAVGRTEEMIDALTAITSGSAGWLSSFEIPRNIFALAYVELAHASIDASDDDASIDYLRRAIEQDPLLPEAHLLLADVFRSVDLDLLAPYHERIALRLLHGTDDVSVDALLDTSADELARFTGELLEEFEALEDSDLRTGRRTTVGR